MIIPSSNLLGFPLDSSQIGYHDDGLPAYSQEYTSSDYRIVLDKLISTGVIADEDSQSLKPSIASGQTSKTAKVRIKAGASMIDGGFAINKSYTDINIVAPEIQGSETSRTKTTYIYIQRFGVGGDGGIVAERYDFVSEESTSSGNSILETPPSKSHAICLARVVSRTTKSGTSYLYQHTVTDLRASEYCGWAAPFVDVDTSAYYDAVQQVVEESKAEVEATIPTLLENAQDSVDSAIAELEEQTQTAVDLAQSAIEGTVAGELDSRITDIEDGLPAYLGGGIEITEGSITNYIEPGTYFVSHDNISNVANLPTYVQNDDGFLIFVRDNHNGLRSKSVNQTAYKGTYVFSRDIDVVNGRPAYGTSWKRTIIKSDNAPFVTSSDITDSAITTQKLADGSVTEDKLAENSVGTLNVKANSITKEKIYSSVNTINTSSLFTIPTELTEYVGFSSTAEVRRIGWQIIISFYFETKKEIPAGKMISLNKNNALPAVTGFGIATGNRGFSGIMYDWGLQGTLAVKTSENIRITIMYASL